MKNKIEYTTDGIIVNDEFILLNAIIQEVNNLLIQKDDLVLLTMTWVGWRGFDDGITEQIVLSLADANQVKTILTDVTISFGEIAGKHSNVYGYLDGNEIVIETDVEIISQFKFNNPSLHIYNYSFLYALVDSLIDYDKNDVYWKESKITYNDYNTLKKIIYND